MPSETLGARGIALDAAVLDAGERHSLVSVRSLGRKGLRVGAFASQTSVPAFSSRWCAASGYLPDCAVDPDGLVDELMALEERYSFRVVVPTRDGTIEALRARRGELESRLTLALASEKALSIAVEKPRTLELSQALGIQVPRTVQIHGVDQLRDALQDVGLPAVVKPQRSWVLGDTSGRRLLSEVVVDLPEARRVLEQALEAGGSVMVQQLLSGTREAVSLLYADGRIWARFAQIAHRMLPPLGGSSVVRESIPLPSDIAEAADSLVTAAGLEGYSEVEFRRDAEGNAMLMEINPRLSASVEVAVRAGVDFPLLLYSWAAGLPLKEVPRYRHGVRMRWLGGDLRWLGMTLRNRGRPEVVSAPRAIASFIADFFRMPAYDYVDVADMRPAMAAMTTRLRRPLRR